MKCDPGLIFCLSTMSCAESCHDSFIPSDRDSRNPLNPEKSGGSVRCPEGSVYCMTINACWTGEDCGPFEAAADSGNDTTCQVKFLPL